MYVQRVIGAVAALIVSGSLGCAASTNGADAPIRMKVGDVSLYINKSGKQITVGEGYSFLDNPTVVTCGSPKGCVLTAEIMVDSDASMNVCTLIDMHCAMPKGAGIEYYGMALQSKRIPVGQHTVQTRIQVCCSGGDIWAWEVNYTVYGHGE